MQIIDRVEYKWCPSFVAMGASTNSYDFFVLSRLLKCSKTRLSTPTHEKIYY